MSGEESITQADPAETSGVEADGFNDVEDLNSPQAQVSPDTMSRNSLVEDSPLLLRVSDAKFLLFLATVVAALLCVHVAKLNGWGLRPIEIQRAASADVGYRIDINDSTWTEWAQLPNIGETTARRIIADRKANGRFRTVDDLTRVSGIGPKTLERLRDWLTVTEEGSEVANAK